MIEDISKDTELIKLEKVEEVEPPKRRLRSNFSMGDPPAKRVKSTSTEADDLKENKPKAVRKVVPFIKYQGDIKYFTNFTDIAAVSDELL